MSVEQSVQDYFTKGGLRLECGDILILAMRGIERRLGVARAMYFSVLEQQSHGDRR